MMFCMRFEWKPFGVNLDKVLAHLRTLGADGIQAHRVMEIWFASEPSEEVKEKVKAYWESIDPASAEATEYKSAAQKLEEARLAKESAMAKLRKIGLSELEVKALLG